MADAANGADERNETSFSGFDRLHQHMVRLHAVVEMGVIGESPAEQARRILLDSTAALNFDYGEIGEQVTGDPGYVRLCAVGEGAEHIQNGIGAPGLLRDRPLMIFDTVSEDLAGGQAASALGLRSVLYWPFNAGGKQCVLALGWKHARDEFISEDEIQYLNFLAALVSRLLEALENQRRIAQRADTDLLTGIPNRAAVLEQLALAISAAQREDSRVAVLYVDLNNFKKLNDEHGHAAGDAALREIASRIQSVLRKHEMCGRFGGDEFCVIVASFRDDDELAIIARRILGALEEPVILPEGVTLNASASVGIAVYPRDGASPNDLLSHADQAMYRAKREGSAAFALYNASSAITVERPFTIDSSTFNSQFVLCYQPIVSARGGRPIAAEVLPRWLHPQGMRSPAQFLSAAREQGILVRLESAIVNAVVEKAAELRHAGDVTYHINVSEPNEALIDALPQDGTHIALEFSEEQVAAEPYRYLQFVSACRARGVRVGLSQFGCGRLPLRALTEMRPDFVKVASGREEGSDWLGLLIDQAHQLSCTVIGEAVETFAEHQWLVASGVDALQGFEISSPLVEQDFCAWLRRYRYAAAH